MRVVIRKEEEKKEAPENGIEASVLEVVLTSKLPKE
jgi:hypothetical protein